MSHNEELHRIPDTVCKLTSLRELNVINCNLIHVDLPERLVSITWLILNQTMKQIIC